MSNIKAKVLVGVNLFSALTVAAYYLTKADGVFFNLSAIIWVCAMIANMMVCLGKRKNAALRTIAMMAPSVLILIAGMLATNADNAVMGISVEILAVIYYVFSAYHAFYLSSDHFAEKEEKPARIIGLVFYIFWYLMITGLFLWYYTYTLVISELDMSSTVAMLSNFRLFLIMGFFASSLGLARRLRSRNLRRIPNVVISTAVILSLMALIPSAAAFDAAAKADMQYTKIFGGESESFHYSFPEAVFGSTESGYSVLEDQMYMTMTFAKEGEAAKDYDLAFDLYTPTDGNGPYPVLLRIHGSGGQKGIRNNALMSEAIASEGYAVVDMNYGNEKVKPSNDILTENLCQLLNYLCDHKGELNLDMDNVFVSGTSRGGKMTIKACVAWANNTGGLKDKITIRGAVVVWGMMNDVFDRTGNERIVSLEELTEDLPPMLFIDTTNDGSVQGGNLLEGVLYTLGVPSANIELRYAMHGANNHYYGFYGQMTDYYTLRFMNDMVR